MSDSLQPQSLPVPHIITHVIKYYRAIFPGGSDGKASAYNAGDPGSIPGSGRFPGEGNGNLLQYSCLENPMDGGAWCPWGHKESDTTERLHFILNLFEKENFKKVYSFKFYI